MSNMIIFCIYFRTAKSAGLSVSQTIESLSDNNPLIEEVPCKRYNILYIFPCCLSYLYTSKYFITG